MSARIFLIAPGRADFQSARFAIVIAFARIGNPRSHELSKRVFLQKRQQNIHVLNKNRAVNDARGAFAGGGFEDALRFSGSK